MCEGLTFVAKTANASGGVISELLDSKRLRRMIT